ncbi:MAG: type II toxin-antitoxin system prevent-host-death family antitoxin [Acidobacteria bacterium]|nr:type II toxin-antitoxin system prevent-host-death family antitoxin [Acidobacteriota bacterium]
MATVTAFEAKTRFGELLDRVSKGEEVVMTRHDKPARGSAGERASIHTIHPNALETPGPQDPKTSRPQAPRTPGPQSRTMITQWIPATPPASSPTTPTSPPRSARSGLAPSAAFPRS